MNSEVKSWQVTTADGVHLVEYHPAKGFKGAKLFVDGENMPLVFKPGYSVLDMPILTGGGHDVRFVLNGRKPDVAYDGVYMDSGDIYEPPQKMNIVNIITTAISGMPIFLGGAIPALCAIGGFALGIFVAANKKLKNGVKIILGILIAVLTWALALGLSHLAGRGINEIAKNVDKKFGADPYQITLSQDFNTDSNPGDITDEGYDVVFAAYSEDAYAYAQSITEKQFKLFYGADVTPDEYIVGFWDIDDNEVKATESGVTYFQTANDSYTSVISVCKAGGSYYETHIFCLNEDAEKMLPKMLQWNDSITITPTE